MAQVVQPYVGKFCLLEYRLEMSALESEVRASTAHFSSIKSRLPKWQPFLCRQLLTRAAIAAATLH
jgi:hypothetical protein